MCACIDHPEESLSVGLLALAPFGSDFYGPQQGLKSTSARFIFLFHIR